MHIAVVLLTLVACQEAPPPAQPPAAPAPSAHVQLDDMDPRKPVPLVPMMALHQKEQMRGHLVVVQEVVAAAAVEDWAAAEAAALRMGTSPQMQTTCEHMGAAADGFTEQALDFHRRADAIAEAARKQDQAAVLRATADTLQACTSCHETWRQQVMSSEDYAAQTGGAAPHGGHH